MGLAALAAVLFFLAQAAAARADTGTGSAAASSSSATSSPDGTSTGASTASSGVTPTPSVPSVVSSSPATGAPAAVPAAPNSSSVVITPNGASSTSSTAPSSPGSSLVTGGQPGIPDVSNRPIPSTSQFRQAISSFVSAAIGALPGSVRAAVGQSALADALGTGSAAACRCTIAISISAGGTATAIGVGGSAPAVAALRPASTTWTGSSVPSAQLSGSTGPATSISISGDGPATANATSGNSAIPGQTGQPLGAGMVQHGLAANLPLVTGAATLLTTQLLLDGGTTSSTINVMRCGAQVCGHSVRTASADVAAYLPNGSSCATSSSGEWCSVAIAVSLGGSAHASITAPGSVLQPAECIAGKPATVGRPTAVAIGVGGPAQAVARMGTGGGGACIGSAQTSTPSPVLARSGSTGSALAISIAQHGAAGSNATSGNAGTVRAMTDGAGNSSDPSNPSAATATTGDTGDAVGIAIGEHTSTALVRSGSSGLAAALCTHCSLPGGDTVAAAQSGRTGGSYGLAVAGLQANVNAVSGDSGEAASWAVHGTGAIFTTGQPSTASTDNVVQTGNPGQVYVSGRSGDTGNVVATATDLLTWVTVMTQSGNAGQVISAALWNADGCTLVFATFTMTCADQPSSGSTQAALGAPQKPGPTTSSQNASDPVVSGAEQGAGVVRRAAQPSLAPALASGPPSSSSAAVAAVQPTGGAPRSGAGATEGSTGHDTGVIGGVTTRLVSSNEVARPAVSQPIFGPLMTWWALLTLCVIATFLVALTFVACRYGRPARIE
jgi:hypothetical protein